MWLADLRAPAQDSGMPTLRFKQVDVFTDKPYLGNPVAVVIGADDLDSETMQRIACWTNLSETTFLLKSDKADYRLRTFTPRNEIAFAGHPTVGSAHAALEAGFVPRKAVLRQDSGSDVLELMVDDQRVFMRGRPAKAHSGSADAAAFGIPLVPGGKLLGIDVGPTWYVGEMTDSAALARLQPDMAAIAAWSLAAQVTGVAVFAPSGDAESAIHLRAFAPAWGIPEDPVTGSANLAIPAYLAHHGQPQRFGSRYVARQGMQVGRDGRVFVRIDADGIRIGGRSVTCVEGTLRV